jgi:hypothetical protein
LRLALRRRSCSGLQSRTRSGRDGEQHQE